MAEDIKSLEDLETVASVDEASTDTAVIREPKRDDFGRSYATGKRKDAIARVWIKPGSGKVMTLPEPGLIHTLAMASFRFPVA